MTGQSCKYYFFLVCIVPSESFLSTMLFSVIDQGIKCTVPSYRIPFIKSEPQEEEETSLESSPGASLQPSGGLAGRRRKQLLSSIKKEDKENERPGEAEELEEMNVCESEPEDYGENVSQPSQLRFPPPKPKGRPPRIRDICTQTVSLRVFIAVD